MSTIVFVGDTAWPRGCNLDIEQIRKCFVGCRIVANLEGPIISANPTNLDVRNRFKFNLYSDQSILDIAKSIGVEAFGLANNHVGDYPGGIDKTVRLLEASGIKVFGTNHRPFTIVGNGPNKFIVIGACSPLTDLHRADGGDCVTEFKARTLLDRIKVARSKHTNLKIVVFIHWGYELARYPLPADREWACMAIDAGADFVIGHHPHVVQGVEKYRHGVIVYSLGNFLLPQTKYRDRVLKYRDPEVTLQLGVSVGSEVELFWFEYDVAAGQVRYLDKSLLNQDRRIQKLTPFDKMNNADYEDWYRSSTRTGTLLETLQKPIFWSYFGLRGVGSKAKLAFISSKQTMRKLAIGTGLHKPYNW